MNGLKETPFKLCLVTDRALAKGNLCGIARDAVRGGVDSIQVREKDLNARELYKLVQEIKIASGKSAKIIINDRVDVAIAAGVDGIHLGWKSLPLYEVKKLLKPYSMIVGVSCHGVEDAVTAEKEGADYITYGPVFKTPSKEGLIEPRGIEGIKLIRKNVSVPVIAIGGIDIENCKDVIDAGADGVAMIRAILCAGDAEEEARKIRRIIS
ncbi:MAG: thiamine phosphate synthase [Candidatus Schekmanbacteria bacterium]|nr:thiamine phosphate synthase [Candidatus Schekmanbacteria bacterium]